MSQNIVKSEFQIMDEADSQQIQYAETAVKQALAYEVRGKKQLSYMGIKWIVLKMSQKEQPLEIIGLPCVELMKHDTDDKNTWIWYATIKSRNQKTGLGTVGASESPYFFNEKYDPFGRTKALSKAERNAYRKQIPELEINAMLDTLSPEDIQPLNTQNSGSSAPNPASEKQLQYLKDLGYTGTPLKTSFGASKLIEKLKNGAIEAKDSEKYCSCQTPVPNAVTNGKTCQTCLKLLEKKE